VPSNPPKDSSFAHFFCIIAFCFAAIHAQSYLQSRFHATVITLAQATHAMGEGTPASIEK
jgi:hypothetical protein